MKTILVPIDFSDATADTLSAASSLAKACSAEILLLHVLPSPENYRAYISGDEKLWEEELVRARRELLNHLADLRKIGIPASCRSIGGEPVATIVEVARDSQADVIVMGSHGHGAIYDLLIGSTSSGVLKAAPCPVMFTPARRNAQANRIEFESTKTGTKTSS